MSTRYSDRALTNVGKLERLDYQVRKCQPDLEFLNTCYKYDAFQTFCNFLLHK